MAPEWAARLHTEMENAGVLHELNIISQNDVVPGYPTPLELNTKIFGVVEKLLALPVAIPRPRGARGSRGIAGAFCNVVGMMTTHRSCDDQSSVESARLEQRNEPLQEFQQDLDQAVGAIGEDAYDKFLVKLRQDWDNKAAARPYVPGATSLRRDSAS